jgi:hypothetical protein
MNLEEIGSVKLSGFIWLRMTSSDVVVMVTVMDPQVA